MKILVIDDDYAVREMYKSLFADLGYEVDTAKNGREGLEKVAIFIPDIILLDIAMPEMSGVDFAKKLSENPNPVLRRIPFVVLTGNSYADVTTQHILRGNAACKAFLPKMVSSELVARTVEAILGKKK